MKLGSKNIESVKLGTKEVSKLYHGNNLVFDSFSINTDLALHYGARSGLDIAESIHNLPAKIIPSCGKFDADNYLIRSVANFGSTVTTGFVEADVYYNGSSTPVTIFASSDEASITRYFITSIISGKPTIYSRFGATFSNVYTATNAISSGWHRLKYESTGSAYKIYVDGNLVTGSATSGSDNGKWIGDIINIRDNISIGCYKHTSVVKNQLSYISYVNFNDTNKWYVNGSGLYEYDVVGGAHMTWTGTTNKYYAIDLPTTALQMLNVGYTLYKKDGSTDEYVPYASANTPYDASAFLSTYEKVGDKTGSTDYHNLAYSLIDFDYLDGASASIAELDRSNTTIWEDLARTLPDYDATNVYRFLAKNILDPRIYYTLRKVGYKGKYHAKIENTSLNITQMVDIRLYEKDNKLSNEFKIMQDCNIDDFAIVEDGNFLIDENNYVIITT